MQFLERIAAAREAERDGAWDRALAEYERVLTSLRDEGGSADDFSNLFRWIGTVHRQRGELERAQESYEASFAVAEGAGLPLQMASALNCLGIVAQYRGDVASATAAYERARQLCDVPGGDRTAAMIDLNYATMLGTRGEFDDAIRAYQDALERFRRLGDDFSAVSALNNIGMAYRDLGQWDAAERCFDEAHALAAVLGDATLIGNIELNRAELQLRRGRQDSARECCDRAFEIFSRAGSTAGLGEACKVYGALFIRTGKPSLAEAHLERALSLAVSAEDRLLEAEVHAHRAQLFLASRKNAEALTALNRAYRLFSGLGARAALLDVEQRLDGLEETYLAVVASWAASIDAKDPYTAGHCGRVAEYASRLAEACGITGRELTWFRMGAFLHDVGKTHVPLEILNKPGKLTPEEWAVMQSHTTAGAEIVSALDFPWDVLPIVRSHHERWDGTGYPDHLAGERIPFTARILCVADIYDALSTARSYRPALSHEETMRIMAADAGRGIDPRLFLRFQAIMDAPPPRPRVTLVA